MASADVLRVSTLPFRNNTVQVRANTSYLIVDGRLEEKNSLKVSFLFLLGRDDVLLNEDVQALLSRILASRCY